MEKPAETQFPITELLSRRWSPRSFTRQAVEPEKIASLFEAARWSPSAGNIQPWAFVIAPASDSELRNKFEAIISESNARWAVRASLLILAVAKLTRSDGQPNFWALYDLGQAVAHLNIQATDLGLVMHQIGGFDREKARKVAKIPEGFEPVTLIAVGYQGDPKDLPDDLRQREVSARVRMPLQEFVFLGEWNAPMLEPALD